MAIIVEDGTGKADAESYATVAYANKYLADRGLDTEWLNLSTQRKEQLLRIATEYIEMRFAARFLGTPAVDGQALSFPRAVGVVPVAVMRATVEYAKRADAAPLVADPVVDERGLQLKSKSEGLGPLTEKVEYVANGASVFKPYPAADMLLKSLLRPTGLIR